MLEPTTTITDYILAAECLLLGVLLFRPGQTASRLWGLAFFAVAVAAVAGGTFHGFSNRISPVGNGTLWKIAVYAIGLTSLLMLASAFIVGTSPPLRQWLLAAASMQFILYAVWMANHNDFRFVIYNYLPAMIGVLLLQILGNPHSGRHWIVGGILLSFVGAGIQRSGITFHPYFNYNDLYHVVQMGAMYLLYRGGLLFSR